MARGCERPPLAVEPVERRLVQPVPGELVHDEDAPGRKEPGDLVESDIEIADVVKGETGDDPVEPFGFLDVLELQRPEELARRGERIDPEHVVARDGQRGRQLTLPAAHVEHPGRRRR